jgi:hypothetical protein
MTREYPGNPTQAIQIQNQIKYVSGTRPSRHQTHPLLLSVLTGQLLEQIERKLPTWGK